MRSVALVMLLAACGDNAGVTPPPDAPPDDPCPPLVLGRAELHFNIFNQLTGVRYAIEGEDASLIVELYDSTTPDLPPLATGSFDVTAAPDDNLATCQHCAYIASPLGDGSEELRFYQVRGTFDVTAITDPLEPVFAGRLDLQLQEARFDAEGRSEFVAGGACRSVEVAFDTTPVDAACTALEDCANELLQVCDPMTQRCVAPQCSFEAGGCAEGQTCVNQNETQLHGACYDECDPRVTSCAAGFTCWQTGPRPELGLCLRDGDGALGAACELEDASTGCVDKLVCSDVSDTCTAGCDLFDNVAPGCEDDERCSLFGRCEPPGIGDPSALGAACTPAAAFLDPCGEDALGYQGYCFAFREQDPLVCSEACLDNGDCRPDQFCAERFTSGLGVCLTDPVCGDGLLGEIDEVCDDGNTAGGDTCSADCQTVDYAASCATAAPIVAGVPQQGDTRTALDGFQPSCQAGRARTELYRFAPGTPGRLTVNVDTVSEQAVAVLAACDQVPDERACQTTQAIFPQPVVLQLLTGDPVTISVGAFTVLDEGPFTIGVEFVAEDCGDGVVAGNEVCDDGNETSNDGCRADCREIEFDAICAAATPLSLAAPNTGDTTTAPRVFENSCSGFQTGPDRVYTFTAPAAGTLSLSLDQGAADLALAVFRGCGEPAEMVELGCSSVLGGNEEVAVDLAAGEQVTVIVDGFNADDAGPYSLAASFQ